ncbi:retrovirus-related pol polyprotein from transposon TNT 1-94 [Tanacetum coccineum]
MVCVVCGKDTNCVRLSASSKQSYVGHRRYLPYNHPFRKQKKAFNGQQEFLLAPIPMTREQIYNEVQHIENKWGKGKRTNNMHQKTKKIREAEVKLQRSIPSDKQKLMKNDEGKPLSAVKSSEVSAELFQKAHLYVIHNTDEIVERELAIDKESVSETIDMTLANDQADTTIERTGVLPGMSAVMVLVFNNGSVCVCEIGYDKL